MSKNKSGLYTEYIDLLDMNIESLQAGINAGLLGIAPGLLGMAPDNKKLVYSEDEQQARFYAVCNITHAIDHITRAKRLIEAVRCGESKFIRGQIQEDEALDEMSRI